MDAYIPTAQTVAPCVAAAANDQPWHRLNATQTLVWYAAPSTSRRSGYSSIDQHPPLTFFIVNAPELAGLERLRVFKDWSDDWDAEGGKAPASGVVDAASKVFSLLSLHKVPQVTLTPDGHPMFVYGAPLNGEVIVTSETSFDYFFADDAAPYGEDVPFDGSSLPQDLLSYIDTPIV